MLLHLLRMHISYGDRKKTHWKKAHRKKTHREKAHMYISAWEKSALGKKRTRKKAHKEKSALGKKRTCTGKYNTKNNIYIVVE